MSDISGQLIKNSYDYVLQSDLVSGNVYRIGGAIPVDPKFLSGLTIFTSFRYADGSEQNGYVLTSDGLGNATWQPITGATPSSGVTSISATTGLSGSSTTGNVILINTAPDQIVSISGGTGILTGGTYPNFTITNSAPDKIVTISGGTGILTGGTYPNFTITNTAPDQVVTLTQGNNILITGTYPNFTISQTGSTGGDFTGGTVTGATIFTNGLSANTISATTYLNLPLDVFVTGGTFNNNTNTLTLERNSGTSIVITGFTDYFTTGATLIGDTIYFDRNDSLSAYSVNLSSFTPSIDVFVTGGSYSNGSILFINNTGGTFTVSGLYTGSTDVFVTGGTYSNGTATFINNTGGTFNVTGFYTGATDVFVTGGTYSASSNTIIFTNNTGGTFNVTGITATGGGTFTGGTVTGPTIFTAGLSANTISATTYQNLPTDIRVTGATYSNNTFTYTNNTGGTFSVLFNTVTGLTVNGNLTVTGTTNTGSLSATSFSSSTLTTSISNTQVVYSNNGVLTGSTALTWTNSATTLTINGTLEATSKSFSIPHPTKEGKKLIYGSLEGPENGVYHRGILSNDNIITLPEYWYKLVDENSITVHLTPIGKYQKLYVKEIMEDKIIIGIDSCSFCDKTIKCHYIVYGERKDINKLEVER